MKKIILSIITAIFILIIMIACALPPSVMGMENAVINGHFLTDQVINSGGWIDSYFADGTYETISRDWDDVNDKWVQASGSRGTYDYDTGTKTMTRTAAERWNWRDEEGWVVLDDYYTENEPDVTSWSIIDSYQAIFTTNGSYNVYLAQDSENWEFIYSSVLKETSNGVESTEIFKVSQIYKLSGSELLFTQENKSKGFDDDATAAEYQREWGGDVTRLAPDGTEWKKGKTVTFYYTETVNRARNWDDGSDAWEAWSDWSYTDIRSRTFTHMGDYMLAVTSQAMKGF